MTSEQGNNSKAKGGKSKVEQMLTGLNSDVEHANKPISGLWGKVTSYFARLKNSFNNMGESNTLLGDKFLSEENYSDAEMRYSIALYKGKKNADAYFGRGIARIKRGKLEKGRADLNQAIKLNPDSTNEYKYNMMVNGINAEVPRVPIEIIKEIYNDIAPEYEDIVDSIYANKLQQEIKASLTKAMGGIKVAKGLDVACATGRNSLVLNEFCSELIGLDVANLMLERAYAKLNAKEKRVYKNLFEGDAIVYLEENPNSADLINANGILQNFYDLDIFLSAVKSCLKKNGYLAITICEYPSITKSRFIVSEEKFIHPLEIVKLAFAKHGFKTLEEKTIDYNEDEISSSDDQGNDDLQKEDYREDINKDILFILQNKSQASDIK